MVLWAKWLQFAAHVIGKTYTKLIRFYEILNLLIFVLFSGCSQDRSSHCVRVQFLYALEVYKNRIKMKRAAARRYHWTVTRKRVVSLDTINNFNDVCEFLRMENKWKLYNVVNVIIYTETQSYLYQETICYNYNSEVGV